ncbi:MAG: GNAT family N-acetyltransferase [Sedimentisphaerales bacterium]|nr:GNAT family N-acetyltransferase [Sedimentisphaerales bacterium]
MRLEIRELQSEDIEDILEIADELSEWFDDDARTRAIPIDVRYQKGYAALVEKNVVGFITLFVAEGRVNIGWLGVKPKMQRSGIGGQLLAKAEEFCGEMGIKELATYTLGEGVDYGPYESTRAFYYKNGFEVFQRSQTDNPSCPEEIKMREVVRMR